MPRGPIWVFLRGNPVFCKANGCLLSSLEQNAQKKWVNVLEEVSNGYLVVTDLYENERAKLVTENNTTCIGLIWDHRKYIRDGDRPGPRANHRKELIESLQSDVRKLLRKSRVQYQGLRTVGNSVEVTISLANRRDEAYLKIVSDLPKYKVFVTINGSNIRVEPRQLPSAYFILK